MRLLRLAAERFRNLEPFDLDVDAQFVVFHGQNAQGKTNVLEAVYLLSTLKPLRARRSKELVRWGEKTASAAADVRHGGISRHYRLDLEPGARKLRLDGKRVADLVDWFAGVRAISFTPGDAAIVLGEPARRRAWVDRAAFTRSPAHLEVVRTYKRVLDQKGALLRSPRVDHGVLDALDAQLAERGARLVERRVSMLRDLEPHVRQMYDAIAGVSAPVELVYRTRAKGEDQAARRFAFAEALAGSRREELRRRTSLVGPQRDEVGLLIAGADARTFGSRGQVRSLVLSLKLAELTAARDRGAAVPLFLLDDVSSELDRARTRRLVGAVRDLGAQVLLTTTAPDHLDALPPADTVRVTVHAGTLVTDAGP
jgi:DNA replication and repair protein RecF